MTQLTYTCLLCGRNRFISKTPHYCAGGYRKHHIKWELNKEEMGEKISKPPTETEYSEAFMAHLYGVNEVRLEAISNLKEQAKNKEEEIRSIAEDFQKECHRMVSGTMQRSTKDVNYQDGTNAWLFYKLAQLSYEIKELKK